MDSGSAKDELLRLYNRFFRFLRVLGVYEYTFHPNEPEQIVRVDKSGFFYWLQIFNVWWVVFMFFSHVILTCVVTDFFGDYEHIILLVQLPWLAGLPLCVAMHVNEMIYRKGTLQLVNFWLVLERQILYGHGTSEGENEEHIKRQTKFLRRRFKIYFIFWASSVFPITNSTINAPYTPSFVPSLNSDAEDKNIYFDWVAKIVYGVGEPYLLHIIYIVTAGFDILIGLMCNSLIIIMDKMSEPLFQTNPIQTDLHYKLSKQDNNNDVQTNMMDIDEIHTYTDGSTINSRVGSSIHQINGSSVPNAHTSLSHDNLYSYYKAIQVMGVQLNYVYGRIMPIVQFFLAFLVAFCLYTAIQYPVHKSAELAFFEFWNFICEGSRSWLLFLPLASLYSKSNDFLAAWKQNQADHSDNLNSLKNEAFPRQVAACKPIQMIRGNLPLKPEDVLEYLNFVTSQAIIMIYQS